MSRFAGGKAAIAICQRCGMWGKGYNALTQDWDTKLWVHPECADRPDPYRNGWQRAPDTFSLRRPTPDVSLVTTPPDLPWDD